MNQITKITWEKIYNLFHEGYYESKWTKKPIKYPYYGKWVKLIF